MQFTTKVQAALLGLCLSAVSAVAAPGLSLSLSGGNSFAGVEDFQITTSLVNTGDAPLKLLKDPRTILSTLPTESFTITNVEGASPQFTGARVKYVPEAALKLENSVVELEPGESIEIQHDLSSAYNFTLPGAGSYDIRANTQFLYVDPVTNEISELEAAHEQSLTSSLTGNLVARPKTLAKRVTYTSCTSSQQSQLASAQTAALSYANAAYTYASSHTSSTTRYVSWFGTYDSTRHSTIVSHYNSIKGYPFTGSSTYDCGCTDSAYAYVNLGEYGVIHLCNAFWPAPTTGTDSKGGTLIHESSHFTQIAGTDDVVYGQSGARSLAKSNPANAIRNADSHEYFAENTPAES